MAQFFYDMGTASNARMPAGIASFGYSSDVIIDPPLLKHIPSNRFAGGSKNGFMLCRQGAGFPLSLNLAGEFGDFEALLCYRRATLDPWDGWDSGEAEGPGIFVRHEGHGGEDYPGTPNACVVVGPLMRGDALGQHRKLIVYRMDSSNGRIAVQTAAEALPVPDGDIEDVVYETTLMRVSVTDSTIKARVWYDSNEEPETWHVDAIISGLAASGKIGIRISESESYTLLKYISIGTEGDPAPTESPAQGRYVSGIVNLPDKSPADGYIVRCHHRESAALLAETLSDEDGSFYFDQLTVGAADKVYCVAIDQLYNSLRAPIKDLITPVAE